MEPIRFMLPSPEHHEFTTLAIDSADGQLLIVSFLNAQETLVPGTVGRQRFANYEADERLYSAARSIVFSPRNHEALQDWLLRNPGLCPTDLIEEIFVMGSVCVLETSKISIQQIPAERSESTKKRYRISGESNTGSGVPVASEGSGSQGKRVKRAKRGHHTPAVIDLT